MRYIYLIFISLLFTNDILITTIITNELKQPISNANIICGQNGTTSNNEGSFSIYCNNKEEISISHINFQKMILPVTIINNNIILKEKIIQINTITIYGGINENSLDNKIKVISKDKYKNNGLTHLEDIILNTPNLMYAGGTSRGQYFQIRGIGELSQFSGEGAPHYYVATIIDNINFSGIGGISLLKDIKQIEVFKGPNTTTFGPNAMAGAINIVSEHPTNNTEFILSSDIAAFNTNNYSLILNKSFSEKFKTRVTIINNYTDGMYYNEFKDLSNTNSKDENLLRIKLFYKNTNNSFYNIALYQIDSNNKYDIWSPYNNGFTTYTDYQGFDIQKTNAFSLKHTRIYNKIKLINIATYSTSDIIYSYDGDWGNDAFWYNPPYDWDPIDNEYEWNFYDHTNRKRINKTIENQIYYNNLVIGLYNSKTKETDNRNGWLFAGDAENIYSNFDISNSAIYLKTSNTINKQMKTDFSVRYDYYKTNNILNYSVYNLDNEEVDYYYPKDEAHKDKTISMNFNFIYKINNTNSIILSIARGNKTGGINQSPNFPNNRYYETDTSNNFEISYKHLNDRFSFDINTFLINRQTPQLRLYVQHSSDPTSFDYATFNANKMNSYGFELSTSYKITENVKLLNEFSFLNSKLSKFTFNNTTYGNRQSAQSPKYQYQISLLFKTSENTNIRLSKIYTDKFYFDDQSNQMSNSYYLLNGSFEISYKNANISLWLKNIQNTKYAIKGYTFALDPTYIVDDYVSYGNRRQGGITVSLKLSK